MIDDKSNDEVRPVPVDLVPRTLGDDVHGVRGQPQQIDLQRMPDGVETPPFGYGRRVRAQGIVTTGGHHRERYRPQAGCSAADLYGADGDCGRHLAKRRAALPNAEVERDPGGDEL
ncbi:hypothetical protein ABT294_18955 [Nonomuraea sp. NPDC000554]|uniref:hypothetical protein n=1 Tax=Nonomuraea sp. NPDC000554 TaxID=3154259 RepID=UPI003329BF0D